MSRIFLIGLLACVLSAALANAHSNSEPGPYLHLDPASEQLYQEGHRVQGSTPAAEEARAGHTGKNLWPYLALSLSVILAFRRLAPLVAARLAERASQPRQTVVVTREISSTHLVHTGDPKTEEAEAARKEARSAEVEALEQFFRNVGEDLASLRKSLTELGRATELEAHYDLAGQLLNQIRDLKSKSNLSDVRPLWQLTCAIEGLLEQISGGKEQLQTSTLRTLASALDLLHSLSVRGLRPDLATQPRPRLLTVDDDPVSRYVVGSSIKRFLAKPESANNGEAALALMEETDYDLIFLDVQMPGMDGFELCSRIHATPRNRTTPIVFVTCLSDFEARTRSSLVGGQDLVSKPFLASELGLKALTMVLRRRLQSERVPRTLLNSSTKPSAPAQPEKGSPLANTSPGLLASELMGLPCGTPEPA